MLYILLNVNFIVVAVNQRKFHAIVPILQWSHSFQKNLKFANGWEPHGTSIPFISSQISKMNCFWYLCLEIWNEFGFVFRVLSLLGLQMRYYPFPMWCDRQRPSSIPEDTVISSPLLDVRDPLPSSSLHILIHNLSLSHNHTTYWLVYCQSTLIYFYSLSHSFLYNELILCLFL
jgi:hypothetical protein